MSVLCDRPTPTGPCQRKVRAPGEPCGANHPLPVSAAPPPSAPAAAGPGPDPFAPPDAPAGYRVARRDRPGYHTVGVGEREGVALDPSTPPETLAALAGDSHWAVRMSVAGNLNASAETLTALAGDSDDGVRSVVEAALPGTAPDRVAELAQDDHWMVRYRVASRVDLPVDVLVELANDWDRKVREGARSNPAFTGPVAAHAGLLAD